MNALLKDSWWLEANRCTPDGVAFELDAALEAAGARKRPGTTPMRPVDVSLRLCRRLATQLPPKSSQPHA